MTREFILAVLRRGERLHAETNPTPLQKMVWDVCPPTMYFAEKACEWPWDVSKHELGLIGALLHARLNNSFDDALFEKLLIKNASE
ncbi:hypothetical protein BCCGELA001_01335 [Bradyrhizobium sp. CCGE-LA001]|nr:hypothetical protein BCCGELA001_01335 [Bradyrhizobium sp. CCGE-LA001]